jgi:glutathione S-transferase
MTAQLISSQICPFAHRAWIAVEEARAAKGGFEFELTNVSLKEKPAFFSEAYSKARGADPASDGKVPVFVEKDGEGAGKDLYLAESAVVAEYVFGKWAPHVLPQRPLDRARTTLFAEQVIGKVRATAQRREAASLNSAAAAWR